MYPDLGHVSLFQQFTEGPVPKRYVFKGDPGTLPEGNSGGRGFIAGARFELLVVLSFSANEASYSRF